MKRGVSPIFENACKHIVLPLAQPPLTIPRKDLGHASKGLHLGLFMKDASHSKMDKLFASLAILWASKFLSKSGGNGI